MTLILLHNDDEIGGGDEDKRSHRSLTLLLFRVGGDDNIRDAEFNTTSTSVTHM